MASETLPPLPCWPPIALPYEPAHGLFRRLADLNGQSSIRPLAASQDLNGRDLDLSEILEFCSRFPIQRLEDLRRNTPVVQGNLVAIKQEVLRFPRDWSPSNPRVCPGCLQESPHLRNWFDLNVLRHCPLHGCELVDDTPWHPKVGADPQTGVSIARRMDAVDHPRDIERYILGRLGVLEKWPLPRLDDIELYQIVDAAELLGHAHLRGWSKQAPQRQRKHSRAFREAVACGFDILAQGSEAECLETYAAGSPVAPVPGRMNFAFYTYWGWVREAINTLEPNAVSSRLKDLLAELAATKGIFSRKGGAELRRKAGLKGLNELADELHISNRSLRAIAVKLGLTDTSSRRAQSHCFDGAAVSQLKDVLDDLVSRGEAARLVNLSLAGFDEFCFRGSIRPLIRLKGRSASADQFRRSELVAAITA